MRAATRSVRSGFTLAEVTVLLVVLGIIAVTVVPAVRMTQPDALTLAGSEVTRVLLAGRNAALQRGTTIRLTIDPGSLEFLIEESGDSAAVPVARGTLALPGGVMLAERRPRIRVLFARTGSAAPESVTLRSSRGSRVIRLDPWSGAPTHLAEAPGSW